MSEQLPKAVSESTLTIGAATLRVFQLDNGTRMIDADDMNRFFDDGGSPEELADAWQTDTEREFADGDPEDSAAMIRLAKAMAQAT